MYVRAYVKWLILVVVLVLHLSIMCNPEEGVEAESFSRAQIRNFAYLYKDLNTKKFRVSATRSRPAQGYDYEPKVTITTRLDQAFEANSSRCPPAAD
jgi:hypothetical protein